MDNKRSQNNTPGCEKWQREIIKLDSEHLRTYMRDHPADHVHHCRECHQFLLMINAAGQAFAFHKKQAPLPDPQIPDAILNRLRYEKIGMSNNPGLRQRLRELLDYRIPVYQAVSGALALCLLTIILLGYYMPDRQKTDLDGRIRTGLELTAVDSVAHSGIPVGQNVREDSLLSRFLVSTL